MARSPPAAKRAPCSRSRRPRRRPLFWPAKALPAPVELARFYVAHAWHGRGIAQALMDAVKNAAEVLGGKTLWLGVWERNARAIAFYEKCGFRTVGSHPFLVGSDLQTDLVMQQGP